MTNQGRRQDGQPGELHKVAQQALTKTLDAMAILHAALFPDWKVDKDHPGYLIKIEPPALFRVPYHVLPSFPSGSELEALWTLSRKIRSGNSSVISISGSNVMRKIFDIVGDVDFCEYLEVLSAETCDRMVSNLEPMDNLVCTRLAVAGQRWNHPWSEGKPTNVVIFNLIDSHEEQQSTLKFDYIGDVESVGVTEISNIVIALDKDGRSAGLRRTFAAQEAPLVPINTLPNQMNDLMEMGRYIDWLMIVIRSLKRDGNMRKCLKRCASLSRILFNQELSNEILNIDDGSRIFLAHRLEELTQLAAKMNSSQGWHSSNLLLIIDKQIKTLEAQLWQAGGPPDEAIRRRFANQVASIAHRLVEQVEPGYDPESRSVA